MTTNNFDQCLILESLSTKATPIPEVYGGMVHEWDVIGTELLSEAELKLRIKTIVITNLTIHPTAAPLVYSNENEGFNSSSIK